MTKFNVGDRVRRVSPRIGYPANYETEIVGIVGCMQVVDADGDMRPFYGEHWQLIVTNTELDELRQFKADAIAKYPDLAPVSEEDGAIMQMYKEVYGTEFKKPWLRSEKISTFAHKCIQWGRDHA